MTKRAPRVIEIKFAAAVLTAPRTAGVTRCPHCGTWLDYEQTRRPNSAEPDHILPVALGGTYDLTNGQVLCRTCNQSKGGRTGHARSGRSRLPRAGAYRPPRAW